MKVVKRIKPRMLAPKKRPAPALIREDQVRLSATVGRSRETPASQIFVAAQPAPGVLPKGEKIAMDEEIGVYGAWAGGQISSIIAEGQAFLGYPYLAELAQRPEYRRIFETIAREMTRKWGRVTAVGKEKTDKVKKLEADLKTFRVKRHFREIAEHDGAFGRGHLFIDLGVTEDPNELAQSIGSGRDETSKMKIAKGSLKRFKTIEPMWVYPSQYNASDPLASDWYKPSSWYVMAKEVHATRLLTIVGREVPDILKPAYMFGGLSMSQMAKPYVDNWLRARQDVSDALHRFSTSVLKTDMQARLGIGGNDLFNRVAMHNNYANNNGTFVLDKDTEDFANVSMPLTSLDLLQAQAQEHMASVSGVPLVILLGISPAGLNASSEGEIRTFEDTIESYQDTLFGGPMQTVLEVLQLNRYGEVDPDIGWQFEPLWSLDEEKKATVRKTEAETDQIRIDSGVISPAEARTALAADADSPYAGLDVDDVPDLDEEEEEGLVVKGESEGEGAKDGVTSRMFAAA